MAHPTIANMTGIWDIFDYANRVSDNLFGVGLVVALYIVVFAYLNSKGEEAVDCLIVAGFISSIAGVFLFIAGLILDKHIIAVVLLCAVPAVFSYIMKSR